MRIRQIKRFALTLKLAVALAAGALHANAQTLDGGGLSLGQALLAARNNFDVAFLRNAAQAAQADVVAADRAPFPTLSAKLSSMDLQNGLGEGDFWRDKRVDKGIGLDWTWERGNKRELRTQGAQLLAKAAQADVEDGEVQQLIAASSAYFDLLAAQERVAQMQGIFDSTSHIAVTAARRVAAGDLARQDALRLEIEAERAKGDVAAAQADRTRAAAALSLLLGTASSSRSPEAVARWPSLKDAVAPDALSDAALQAWIADRPDVRAADERLSAARVAVDSVGAQKKADVTWGFSVDHFPGTSTSLLELRLQMPLQHGYEFQGEAGRAQAQLRAAEGAAEKSRRAAWLDMQGLYAQLASSSSRARSFDAEIVPRARQVAEQAELAYTKGAIALGDLLDARRTLRGVLLDALAARADHAKSWMAWRLRTQPLGDWLTDPLT